jgi:integrase
MRARLWACLDRLKGDIIALESAVEAWSKRQSVTQKPVAAVIAECIASKESGNRRDIYVQNFGISLKKFGVGRESRSISEITSQEVSDWLNGNGWAVETRRGYLSRLKTLFSFAVKRGYSASNPALGVDRPSSELGPPQILSIDDCKVLLRTCRKEDEDLVPYCVLGLFAGIRPDEIKRLTKEQIRDGWVRIEASKAKTRKRRLVELLPPADEWLALTKGEFRIPKNFAKRWRKVRDASGVKWSHDVMRHSFCSYALPIYGAAKVSLMAGNSEDILFRHYRELVPKSEAERFWKLTPTFVDQP